MSDRFLDVANQYLRRMGIEAQLGQIGEELSENKYAVIYPGLAAILLEQRPDEIYSPLIFHLHEKKLPNQMLFDLVEKTKEESKEGIIIPMSRKNFGQYLELIKQKRLPEGMIYGKIDSIDCLMTEGLMQKFKTGDYAMPNVPRIGKEYIISASSF